MREQGFRFIQVWVPDVRSAWFAAEAATQSAIMGEADQHSDDQAIDAVSADWGE